MFVYSISDILQYGGLALFGVFGILHWIVQSVRDKAEDERSRKVIEKLESKGL